VKNLLKEFAVDFLSELKVSPARMQEVADCFSPGKIFFILQKAL
jgi:hypothetical protein